MLGGGTAIGDCPSILLISERVRVTAKVTPGHLIVNGAVDGPIRSTELLELQPRAVVVGDVRYEVLEMHPGCHH